MTDVPSSDWVNDLSLMSTNLPEHYLSYRQRIAHTSRAHVPTICALIYHLLFTPL